MNSWKRILTGSVLLAALPLISQNAKSTDNNVAHSKRAVPPASPEEIGQRVFEQNCSRCHDAPQGFSPRISGTIVRHMRVRASLSEKDAQELLRFLNP